MWLNRGTLAGLLCGLLLGGGSVTAWFLLREQPKEAANTEQAKQEPPKPEAQTQPPVPPPRVVSQAERAAGIRKLAQLDEAHHVREQLRRILQAEIRKLEQLAESLRLEIDSTEEQIELISKTAAAISGDDNATRIALLQRRHIEADAEFNKVNREIGGLEVELEFLKKQLAGQTPPDAVLKQKLTQLETTITIKKENREKHKAERDGLKKLLAAGIGGGLNIQAMKDALKPQREQLAKVEAHLAHLRAEQQRDE